MSKIDRVRKLVKEMDEHEVRLAEIRAELSALVPEDKSTPDAAPTRVLSYFKEHSEREVTVSEICQELQIDRKLVWTACLRLEKRGRVVKTGRGMYQYSDAPRRAPVRSEVASNPAPPPQSLPVFRALPPSAPRPAPQPKNLPRAPLPALPTAPRPAPPPQRRQLPLSKPPIKENNP